MDVWGEMGVWDEMGVKVENAPFMTKILNFRCQIFNFGCLSQKCSILNENPEFLLFRPKCYNYDGNPEFWMFSQNAPFLTKILNFGCLGQKCYNYDENPEF